MTDRAREAKAAASLQELGTPLLEVFLAQGEEGQLRSQPVSLRPPSTGDDSKGTARCVAGLRVLLHAGCVIVTLRYSWRNIGRWL